MFNEDLEELLVESDKYKAKLLYRESRYNNDSEGTATIVTQQEEHRKLRKAGTHDVHMVPRTISPIKLDRLRSEIGGST
jgi:hypothetical protein